MLDYDRGVCYQRPEIVWLEARISLEMLEEGSLVGVIVRVYYILASTLHVFVSLKRTHKIASPITASTKLLFSSYSHSGSYPYVCPSLLASRRLRYPHWSSVALYEVCSRQQTAFAAGILDISHLQAREAYDPSRRLEEPQLGESYFASMEAG